MNEVEDNVNFLFQIEDNVKLLFHFVGTKPEMSTSDSGLVSTRRLESSIMFQMAHRARKTPPPDCWNLKKKSNPLSFVSLGKKKGLFMLNTTFPIKAATLLFPGTLANLPPPFFHT